MVSFSANSVNQPSVSPTTPDAPVLEQKDSVIWRCVGCKADEYGGFLFRFVSIIPEFFANRGSDYQEIQQITEEFQKKILDAFPAEEPESIEKILFNYDRSYVESLGYEVHSSHEITMPDITALVERIKRTVGPKFTVCSSEGIASDRDFIQAFLHYDVLLSSNKEFVHDHTAHILLLMKSLNENPNHKENISRLRGQVKEAIKNIEQAEKEGKSQEFVNKCYKVLAIKIDYNQAAFNKDFPKVENLFGEPEDANPLLEYYWNKIFGSLDHQELKEIQNLLGC